MDEKRPNRRKDKYNPYNIYKTQEGTFHLRFRDGEGALQDLEISEELYQQFNQFELDDLSYLNVVDRHYEQSEQTEASVNARAFSTPKSLEDEVMEKMESERLYRAIMELSEVQRRRLILYYFEGLTYEQIAQREGCTISPVKNSIDRALEKLEKILETRE